MRNNTTQNSLFWKKITLLTLLFLYISNVNAQCWKSVSTGPYHTIAVKNDGTLWSWGITQSGSENYGALGQGTGISCIPKQVGTDSDWETVSAANYYSLALKTNGTLWACGSNSGYGSTGFSSSSDVLIPTQVGVSTNWKSISAGMFLAMGIKTDGTLWGWSSYNGTSGNIVNGISQNTPTQIGIANNWKEVSCGYNHTIALKTDNTLWTCGYNPFGELGNGNNTDVNVLTQIGTATDWKTISAGEKFSLAIKTDGTLWAWGRNNYNQLGDGTLLNKNVPTKIGTATDWLKTTAASFDHGFAIKTNGTLWGWGRNLLGNLGDGTTTNKTSPTQIGNATNWNSISGNYHTMALKTDNTLWGCGTNWQFAVGIPNNSAGSTTNLVTNLTQISCPDPIIASTDYGTAIYGNGSVAINNVLLNDTYFGSQATTSNIKLNFVSSTNSGITLNTSTGAVNVAATVPIGTYTLTYSICDINTPYCSYCGTTGTVTISIITTAECTYVSNLSCSIFPQLDNIYIFKVNTNPSYSYLNLRYTWTFPNGSSVVTTTNQVGSSQQSVTVKIELLDIDNSVICSGVTSCGTPTSDSKFMDSNSDNSIELFPNPTLNKTVSIKGNQSLGKCNLQVVDLNGRVVYAIKGIDLNIEKTINLNHLQSGIYIVKIGGEKISYTKKIILN